MEEVKIVSEYIKLGQFLKFAAIIGNGAEAKQFLELNKVYVNSELDQRRGRKLYPNDIVKVLNKEYIIKAESVWSH